MQKQLLEEINTTLIETELFSPEDIKSRARKDEVFLDWLRGRSSLYSCKRRIFCLEELPNKNSLWGEQLLAALSNKNIYPRV